MLETYIRSRLQGKEILLMTHIVIGYPSWEESFEIVGQMVAAGVDLMELQIPFSEPIADGPVILQANQKSLGAGATVAKCLEFGRRAAETFKIPFLFMSYYNILFKYGLGPFVNEMAAANLKGAIVPDLPPRRGKRLFNGHGVGKFGAHFHFLAPHLPKPDAGHCRTRRWVRLLRGP